MSKSFPGYLVAQWFLILADFGHLGKSLINADAQAIWNQIVCRWGLEIIIFKSPQIILIYH